MNRDEPIDLVKTGKDSYREPHPPAINWWAVPGLVVWFVSLYMVTAYIKGW